MKKILLILVVGILIINGFGAVAFDKDIEKLDSDAINYKKINNEKRDFTHTVLGEYGTATWCGFCHYAHTALKNIYASGDYPFYYVSLVRDKNIPVCDPRLFDELNLYGYPTVYFDGGDKVVVGGYVGVEDDQRAAIVTCGNREVYDVDIDLNVLWLGGTEMKIDVSVDNNEDSTYDGTIRVYITEIVSSMGWKDTTGEPYTFPLLDFAFKDDGTGKVISIPAGSTWSDSTIWNGSAHGFPSITVDNIMVIAAVFNDEWHQGYAYPPSDNPFDAYYVDDTIAVPPDENAPPEIPEKPDGPTNGVTGTEYKFTSTTTDPDGDKIYYMFDWGDGIFSKWLGFYSSGETVEASYEWAEAGDYDVHVKAKDINGTESDWSEPHTITIIEAPDLDIIKIGGRLFRVDAELVNIGEADANDVSWEINLEGGLILLGGSSSGTIDIPAHQLKTIQSNIIIGFGPVTIRVNLDHPLSSAAYSKKTFILGILIL